MNMIAPQIIAPVPSLLSCRAMLANLSITQWTARKLDRKVTDETNRTHGAAADAGRFNKCLIAQSSLSAIVTAANAARSSHYDLTQPWANDGSRILSVALHDKYADRMRKHRADFERALDEFMPAYPSLVQESRVRLGAMFNPADYPEESAIRSRFTFSHSLFPVPDAADFRVDMGQAQLELIRAEIQAASNAALAGAMRDAWDRVADTVGHMVQRLNDYKPATDGQKATGIFRDSLVENVRSLVDILPGLNITQDSKLAAVTNRMRDSLCRHDADVLRESDVIRDRVRTEADAILADVSAFMA
jgi:hypothetical protein